MRLQVLAVGLSAFVMGCAAAEAQRKPPEWVPRVDDLGRSQARMATRMEDMAQVLQTLRDRLDGQEAALKELRTALEDQETRQERAPTMPVIRVEPLPAPGAERVSAGRSPQEAEADPRVASSPAAGTGRPEAAEGPAKDPSQAADLYRRAYNAFREARYGQAILDFEEFLRRHPDSEYADNAQYWIGECYYSQGEYAEAVAEFARVAERYPNEAKAPDALVKMGLGYEKLREPESAREAWRRVASEYADTDAATQARTLLGAAR